MWPFTLSGRLLIVALVGRYPANWLIKRGSILKRNSFLTASCEAVSIWDIIRNFSLLSPSKGQVTHALLTRPPLEFPIIQRTFRLEFPFDLHVLGTPPAFILSQDQTLLLENYFLASYTSLKFFVSKIYFVCFFKIFLKKIFGLRLFLNNHYYEKVLSLSMFFSLYSAESR